MPLRTLPQLTFRMSAEAFNSNFVGVFRSPRRGLGDVEELEDLVLEGAEDRLLNGEQLVSVRDDGAGEGVEQLEDTAGGRRLAATVFVGRGEAR